MRGKKIGENLQSSCQCSGEVECRCVLIPANPEGNEKPSNALRLKRLFCCLLVYAAIPKSSGCEQRFCERCTSLGNVEVGVGNIWAKKAGPSEQFQNLSVSNSNSGGSWGLK
jgi:hypothetical protein